MKESDCVSHSVMSNSVQTHGEEPTKLFCPWDSPGKNTGVGCYVLLQEIFPTQHLYIYTYIHIKNTARLSTSKFCSLSSKYKYFSTD